MNNPFTGTFFQRLIPHFQLSDPLYCHDFPAKATQFPAIEVPANDFSGDSFHVNTDALMQEYSAVDTLATMQLWQDQWDAIRIHDDYVYSLLVDALDKVREQAAGPGAFGLVNVVLPGYGSQPDVHVVLMQRGDDEVKCILLPAPDARKNEFENTPIQYHNAERFDKDYILSARALTRYL